MTKCAVTCSNIILFFFQRCFTKRHHRTLLQNCGNFGPGFSHGRSGLKQRGPWILPVILRLLVPHELDFLTGHLP